MRENSAVSAYFERLPDALRPVGEALRSLILEAGPELTETLKWGAPSYGYLGNVCYLMAQQNHLNFGFYQATLLPDPEKLLEGTGSKMRHIKVRTLQDIREAAFRDLIRAALKLHAPTIIS